MSRRFPGVDPYLEGQNYWPDFHSKFLNSLQEAIADGLPDAYEARIDERVRLLDHEAGTNIQIRPDVSIAHSSSYAPSRASSAILAAETIPTVVLDEDREVFVKILHRPDRKLITILELLSPANKEEPGRRDYVFRRNAILWQAVHLVELDLLVAGQRLPMHRPLPRGDYHALVARWEQRPDCQVYSWSVRAPLPSIPVPLRAPDPDLEIDLTAVYETTFERGRYARSIDYQAPSGLPFSEEDQSWVEQTARGGGPA